MEYIGSITKDYNRFFEFIETYAPAAFKGIDRSDHLILELEKMMESNNQFFHIGDILQMRIIFCSKGSIKAIGIDPDEITPYHFFEATHPDDLERHTRGRAKMVKIAYDLYTAGKGSTLMSTNIRLRNPQGLYTNLLYQLYFFYSTVPVKTVYLLKIHTNLDWFTKRKHGYHYYISNNLSFFRYPDPEMLMMGNPFSDREFEIIKLIESGMGSEAIADKLFLSVHTVNTHRRNILEKSGKESLAELIYELIERGVM